MNAGKQEATMKDAKPKNGKKKAATPRELPLKRLYRTVLYDTLAGRRDDAPVYEGDEVRRKPTGVEAMMIIDNLLDIADEAYGDGTISDANNIGDDCGDTLALFIVRELRDTFDAENSDADQLADAATAMEMAKSDIERVIASLDRAADVARRKEAQKKKG